jgi:hypothetical protein
MSSQRSSDDYFLNRIRKALATESFSFEEEPLLAMGGELEVLSLRRTFAAGTVPKLS